MLSMSVFDVFTGQFDRYKKILWKIRDKSDINLESSVKL